MRRAISTLALATLAIVMVLGASAAYAFSTQALGATTVTYTKTVVQTSAGQVSTVAVPTTVTDTSTSASATTLTTTQTLTSTQTLTTNQTLTSTQTVTDTTTTMTTTSSTTSGPLMFGFAVTYTVFNQTSCQAQSTAGCTWSGTLSWPTSACNFAYSCEKLQLGPQSDSETYSFPLASCGLKVTWSVSTMSPLNQTRLSISLTNEAGQILYQDSTSSNSTALIGSYSPC